MDKMKVSVITDVKTIEVQEFPIPEILPHEVLYQIKSFALCTVEQRAYAGLRKFPYPFVGGHENAGVVVKVGEAVTEFDVGDKVIATFGYCGSCDFCKQGLGTQCANSRKNRKRFDFEGMIVGGAMSPYLAVPSHQLSKLEPDADLKLSALSEPLACCIHSTQKAKIKFGDTVVIIGAGIMGYLHMKLALMQGARVIISEVDEARIEKVKNAGAHYVFNPAKDNVVEKVKSLTKGYGAAAVINTIANPVVWGDAQAMLAPFGRLIAYSSQDNSDPVGISFGQLHSKEYEYIGTVSPTYEANMRASKMINFGLINMEEVVDSYYNIEDAKDAFERAIIPNTYRVVISYE